MTLMDAIEWVADASAFVTIGGAIAAFAFWLGSMHANMKANVKSIEKTEKNLEETKKSAKNTEKRIDKVVSKLNQVARDVVEIQRILAKNSGNQFLQSSSPIQLTKDGEKLFDRVKGPQIVKNHLDKIPIKEDMNAYEIQKTCTDFAILNLIDILPAEEKDAVQLVAYEDGIDLESILHVLGICFRDEVLKSKK